MQRKKKIVLFSSLRIPEPNLHFESPRPLSLPWGPPDFLSTYLGIDSLRMRWLDGVTNSWTWVWVSSRSWWWTGRPVCCSPWGHKESDTTEWLNWTDGCWYYCGYGSHHDSMAILHNMANCCLVLEDPMNVDSRASFLSTLCLLFNSLKTHVL